MRQANKCKECDTVFQDSNHFRKHKPAECKTAQEERDRRFREKIRTIGFGKVPGGTR